MIEALVILTAGLLIVLWPLAYLVADDWLVRRVHDELLRTNAGGPYHEWRIGLRQLRLSPFPRRWRVASVETSLVSPPPPVDR